MVLSAFLSANWFLMLVGQVAERCNGCLDQGGMRFCLDDQSCRPQCSNCSNPVDLKLNCPSAPAFRYNDTFFRRQVLTFAVASSQTNPQECLDNNVPSMILYKIRRTFCSESYPNVTCTAYTAVDPTQKAILVAFRGSMSTDQIMDQHDYTEAHGSQQFFDKGRVLEIFYNYFISLWKGGLGSDLSLLKRQYPSYNLWIAGHSLGAALSLVASSYIAVNGMYKGERMRIMTMGTPRVGDYNFAEWHGETFTDAFHIVHSNDFVPRVPAIDPKYNIPLYHPKTEVWYNNNMEIGADYEICAEADRPFCSTKFSELSTPDHMTYFNIDMQKWGKAGCPKNRHDFQPNGTISFF